MQSEFSTGAASSFACRCTRNKAGFGIPVGQRRGGARHHPFGGQQCNPDSTRQGQRPSRSTARRRSAAGQRLDKYSSVPAVFGLVQAGHIEPAALVEKLAAVVREKAERA